MLLYERILKIIDDYEGGNKTAFARRVGIQQTTLLGYLSESGQAKLRVEHLNAILSQYPEIDRDWLFFGESEALSRAHDTKPNYPDNALDRITTTRAENSYGVLIGDTLSEFFREINVSCEFVMTCCRFDDTFWQVMENNRYPTFQELERLYMFFGVDVGLLFQEMPRAGTQMSFTSFERLLAVTNLKSYSRACYFADAMGIEKDNWREWHRKYKKALSDRFDFLEKYGTLKPIDDEETYDSIEPPELPELPLEWTLRAEEYYGIPKGYLFNGKMQFKPVETYSKDAQLQKELEEVREKCALQQKLIAMYEEREMGEAAQRQAV